MICEQDNLQFNNEVFGKENTQQKKWKERNGLDAPRSQQESWRMCKRPEHTGGWSSIARAQSYISYPTWWLAGGLLWELDHRSCISKDSDYKGGNNGATFFFRREIFYSSSHNLPLCNLDGNADSSFLYNHLNIKEEPLQNACTKRMVLKTANV